MKEYKSKLNSYSKKSAELIENGLASLKKGYSQVSPAITKYLQDIKEKAITAPKIVAPKDLFTTKCEVPLYVVPSGYTPNDYKIFVDFSLFEIKSKDTYKLPLPQIELYTAHSLEAFHLRTFQDTLIQTFTDYFHSSMQNIYKEYKKAKKVEQIVAEETKKESGLFIKWIFVIGAIGGILIATNPLIDLAFLLVALTGGYSAVKEFLGIIKDELAGLLSGKSKVDRAYKKDTRLLKAKEAQVRKAISNIQPIIHPGLVALQELINKKSDKIDIPIRNRIIDSRPTILPMLQNIKFLSQFPQKIKRQFMRI